ncbi:Fic family protein [Sphingobacterium mizutaii]|uniref:Fic family protein n=1 Tax=Sphingobacterium mizutaii TaxID=1010 RepID=UPI001628F2F7|nr:Fic family protein [Sphingobacterium mizutaii]
MNYKIPNISSQLDLFENIKNIEKIVDNLNKRRDEGFSEDLNLNLRKHLIISSVYNSNAIEGNRLSLRETENILNGMVVNERPLKDEIEARSLSNATEYLYKLIEGSEALTKRTLLELHSLLMENIPNVEGGQFRKNEVSIKNSNHEPISFLFVEEEIDNLFKWMNRNIHKYNPITLCAIIHHWLVWIHPFADGNGRVSRLFTNFFLLQKGYPEIVIKIGDRDKYYNALVKSDSGDVTELVELFSDKLRQTVNVYEEFFNEYDRQQTWIKKFKKLGAESNNEYEKKKETYSFQYEVWKNQIAVFKALLAENVKMLETHLQHITFNLKEYDILSYSQFLDLMEDRRVSNTWYLALSFYNKENGKSMGVVFYFERFRYSTSIKIDNINSKRQKKPEIKLYVSGRDNQASVKLDYKKIDLVNVGTWGDQLSFGVHNRNWDPKKKDKNPRGSIVTIRDNPSKIVRTFLEQTLYNYLDVGKNRKFNQTYLSGKKSN